MIAKGRRNPSRFEEERDNPFPWTEAAVTTSWNELSGVNRVAILACELPVIEPTLQSNASLE